MINYPFASSPTIAERVLQGLEANSTDGGGIIPLRDEWNTDMIGESWARPAQNQIAKLRADGWKITRYWFYHDGNGKRISAAMRLDHPERGKQVMPVRSSGAVGIMPRLEIKAIEPPRPLYNLHRLAQRPNASVLMVEGEKAADAGSELFPDYVSMTWSSGAPGVMSADLRPLAGRHVILWPDHDENGLKAMARLGPLLAAVGAASVRIVCVPASFPKKWDIADQAPEAADG